MTQQEILDRVQFIGELRGLATGTMYNYGMAAEIAIRYNKMRK